MEVLVKWVDVGQALPLRKVRAEWKVEGGLDRKRPGIKHIRLAPVPALALDV